jgi:hypothetical protein
MVSWPTPPSSPPWGRSGVSNLRLVVAYRISHEVNLEEFEAQGAYSGDQTLEPGLIGNPATHRRHSVVGYDVTSSEGCGQRPAGGAFEREFVNQLSHGQPLIVDAMASP